MRHFYLWIFVPLVFGSSGVKAADLDCRIQPLMETHKLPAYPKESVQANEEGQVMVVVTLNNDGIPNDGKVLASSNYPRLDQAVLDYVKASWRWKPFDKGCGSREARVNVTMDLRDARVQQGFHSNNVVMTKNDFPPEGAGAHGETLLMISLRQTVNFPKISLIRSSGNSALDGRAQEFALLRFKYMPAKIDDKPADTVLYLNVIWPENPQ